MSIDFVGSEEVSSTMPKDLDSRSLSEGGPIVGGPESNRGMSTSDFSICNGEGSVPMGNQVKFVGSND